MHLLRPFKVFSPLESNYEKLLINSLIIDFAIDFSRTFIAKYTEKNLQKIIRIVLKAHVAPSDRFYEKLLKIK